MQNGALCKSSGFMSGDPQWVPATGFLLNLLLPHRDPIGKESHTRSSQSLGVQGGGASASNWDCLTHHEF